ncbi:MAG: hypothetical protein AAFP86_22540, partial [Planctomycetota bacterium]
SDDVPAAALDKVRGCMDRFELEDHYVPFRRPEPEVQLALDRGLGALADLIVAPVPKDKRKKTPEESAGDGADETRSIEVPAEGAEGTPPAAPLDASPAASADETPAPDAQPSSDEGSSSEAEYTSEAESTSDAGSTPQAESAPAPEAAPTETSAGDESTSDAAAASAAAESSAPESTADASGADAPVPQAAAEPAPAAEGATTNEEAAPASAPDSGAAPESAGDAPSPASEASAPAASATPTPQPEPLVVTAALAQLCAPFVDPDKGVHTEAEALAGAVRILSDRIGRDPALRGFVRRVMRKKGGSR